MTDSPLDEVKIVAAILRGDSETASLGARLDVAVHRMQDATRAKASGEGLRDDHEVTGVEQVPVCATCSRDVTSNDMGITFVHAEDRFAWVHDKASGEGLRLIAPCPDCGDEFDVTDEDGRLRTEAHARRHHAADAGRLLNAAGAIGYAVERLPGSGSRMTQAAHKRMVEALALLDAALAADPAPAGLEVERLARADWEVFGGARASGSTWDDLDDRTKAATLDYARQVAAEYARLIEGGPDDR